MADAVADRDPQPRTGEANQHKTRKWWFFRVDDPPTRQAMIRVTSQHHDHLFCEARIPATSTNPPPIHVPAPVPSESPNTRYADRADQIGTNP